MMDIPQFPRWSWDIPSLWFQGRKPLRSWEVSSVATAFPTTIRKCGTRETGWCIEMMTCSLIIITSSINHQHDTIFIIISGPSCMMNHHPRCIFSQKSFVIYRGPDQHPSGRPFWIYPMEPGRPFGRLLNIKVEAIELSYVFLDCDTLIACICLEDLKKKNIYIYIIINYIYISPLDLDRLIGRTANFLILFVCPVSGLLQTCACMSGGYCGWMVLFRNWGCSKMDSFHSHKIFYIWYSCCNRT